MKLALLTLAVCCTVIHTTVAYSNTNSYPTGTNTGHNPGYHASRLGHMTHCNPIDAAKKVHHCVSSKKLKSKLHICDYVKEMVDECTLPFSQCVPPREMAKLREEAAKRMAKLNSCTTRNVLKSSIKHTVG